MSEPPMPGPPHSPQPPNATAARRAFQPCEDGPAGRKQKILVQYSLCGLEDLAAMLTCLIGGALMLPGAVTGLVVLIRARRRRRSAQRPPTGEPRA